MRLLEHAMLSHLHRNFASHLKAFFLGGGRLAFGAQLPVGVATMARVFPARFIVPAVTSFHAAPRPRKSHRV